MCSCGSPGFVAAFPSFTPQDVFAEMQLQGTLGDLSLSELEAFLDLGAKRGLWLRRCDDIECRYQFTRDVVALNWSNREFVNSTLLQYVSACDRVSSGGPQGCGACYGSKGAPDGAGYFCCQCPATTFSAEFPCV